MEPTTVGRSISLPSLKTIIVCAVFFALAVVLTIVGSKYLVVSSPDGGTLPILLLHNVLVDLGCCAFAIFVSEMSTYELVKSGNHSSSASRAKVALFLTLTAVPVFAQHLFNNTDAGHGPKLFQCWLTLQHNDLPGSIDSYWTYTVFGLLSASALLALFLAYSLNRHTTKPIEKEHQVKVTYSEISSLGSSVCAVILWAVYLIFSHSNEAQLECAGIGAGYRHLISAAFLFLIVLVGTTVFLTRNISRVVLLPAIFENKPAHNFINGCLCFPTILFSFCVLYLFATYMQLQSPSDDWMVYLKLLASAFISAIGLITVFISEGLPGILFVVYSISMELIDLLYSLFFRNSRITAAVLIFLLIPTLSYLAYRMLRLLLAAIKYYPHILLFLIIVALSAVGGYLVAHTLKERNTHSLTEIRLNAEQKKFIEESR